MSLADQTRRAGPYTGNGVTTAFAYDFLAMADTAVAAVVTEPGAAPVTLVLGTDYSVTGVGVEGGGDVVLTSPLAVGKTLTIIGAQDYAQDLFLSNQGPFFPKAVMTALDRQMVLAQQLREQMNRTLMVQPDAAAPTALAAGTPQDRADRLLSFSADGLALEAGATTAELEAWTSGAEVSAAAAEVSAAAAEVSAAAAEVSAAAAGTSETNAANSAAVVGPSEANVATLIASTDTFADGTLVRTREEGYSYRVDSAAVVGFIENSAPTPQKLVVLETSAGINCRAFGVIGDGVVDDTAAMQNFADAVMAKKYSRAVMEGIFKVTGKISFISAGTPTSHFLVSASFNSAFASSDEVVLFEGVSDLRLVGELSVFGQGSATYATRTNMDCIVFQNCSRLLADKLIVYYAKRWGVQFLGTTSQYHVNYIKAWYCGGSGGTGVTSKTEGFTVVGNSGGQGSTVQFTTIELDNPVDGLTAFNSMMKIGDTVTEIRLITDLTTLQVYPWVENGIASGTASFYVGGGVLTVGSDVSAGYIGKLDSLVCGIGLRNISLYPASVASHVSQVNGIAHAIGSKSNAAVSGSAQYTYFESNDFDIVVATTYGVNYTFTSTTNVNLAKCFRIGPRTTAGEVRTWNTFNTVKLNAKNKHLEMPSNLNMFQTGNPVTVSGIPNAIPTYLVTHNTPSILIANEPDVARLYGGNNFLVLLRGTGSHGQPTGDAVFTPPAGQTVNGGAIDATFTMSNFAHPTFVHVWFLGGSWVVERMGYETLTAPLAATGGTIVDAEARAALNDLIASLKTVRLLK